MTLSQTNPETRYTLLLSADQYADSADEDWIREATPEEIAAVEERHPGIAFDEIAIDKTGRPYYWVTVDGARCPTKVLVKASQSVRVMRW